MINKRLIPALCLTVLIGSAQLTGCSQVHKIPQLIRLASFKVPSNSPNDPEHRVCFTAYYEVKLNEARGIEEPLHQTDISNISRREERFIRNMYYVQCLEQEEPELINSSYTIEKMLGELDNTSLRELYMILEEE